MVHICIYLLSDFVGSVGGSPEKKHKETFAWGLYHINSITTVDKNVQDENQHLSKSRPTGS